MSYYIDQIKIHAGLHIKQYGHAKFTVKRWKSAVRRNLTTDSYGDWECRSSYWASVWIHRPAAGM